MFKRQAAENPAQVKALLDENKKLREGVIKYAQMAQDAQLHSEKQDEKLSSCAEQLSKLTAENKRLAGAPGSAPQHAGAAGSNVLQAQQAAAIYDMQKSLRDLYTKTQQALLKDYQAMQAQLVAAFTDAIKELQVLRESLSPAAPGTAPAQKADKRAV